MDEAQVRNLIRHELQEWLASDRYIFHTLVQFLDGRNVQLGRTTGTKIGLSTAEKLGLWGVTPVDQPATVADPSVSSVSGTGDDTTINNNFTNVNAGITAIIDRLQEVGIIA